VGGGRGAAAGGVRGRARMTDTLQPRKNPALLGHEAAEAALLDAWQSGRLAHAWLICGPRGIGKATLAFRFARFVLAAGDAQTGAATGGGLFGNAPAAPQTLAIDPDNPVFHRVASGGHSDLFTVERTVDPKKKKLRNQIIVGDVRAATRFLHLTAGEGAWRAVVVDCADEMNRNATNAILKMLEEPPPATLFLLVSHAPGRLLATIRSRCRILTLQPLDRATVGALLGEHRPDLAPADAEALAGLAAGSIGDALALADAGGLDLYREMIALLGALPSLDFAAIHALGDRLARTTAEGNAFSTFTRMLENWLSRLVRDAARGADAAEFVPGEGAAAAALRERADLAQCLSVWEKIAALFAQAERANLDRKQVVVSAFLILQAATRPAASS